MSNQKAIQIDKATCDFLVTESMVQEVEKILSEEMPYVNGVVNEMVCRGIDRIYFVACGSPLSAAKTAAMMANAHSTIQCEAISAQTFIDTPPFRLDEKCAVVGISDYGSTQEVIDAVKLGMNAGALTMVFTSKETNPIANIGADHVVAYHGGCIWEIHLLLSYAVVGEFIRLTQPNPEVEAIMADLQKLPPILERLVTEWEEKGKAIGEKTSDWSLIYTVSAGMLNPLGYKEGIVSCLEFTWTNGSCIEAGEFRHGALEIVDADSCFMVLQNTDSTRRTTQRAINFIEQYTDNLVVIDNDELDHDLHDWVSPFVMFVPLEWIYFYHSEAKGHNPDDRRAYGGLRHY